MSDAQLLALTLAGTIVLLVATFFLERTAGRGGGARRPRGWDAYDAVQKLVIVFGATLGLLLLARLAGALL